MLGKQRVYISVPVDLTEEQTALKMAILATIERQGFEPQIFHERGLPANKGWSFEGANELMAKCDGAVVLAFAKWYEAKNIKGDAYTLPSEYNHFEGALAVAHDTPLLLVTDRQVRTAGITWQGGGLRLYFWPDGKGAEGVEDPAFQEYLQGWADEVRSHRRVFIGYCSAAKPTADALTLFIDRQLEIKTVNYALDFLAGSIILDQIAEAARSCSCAIFLFTKDDELASGEDGAAPRDNVIFEAGYFTRARGRERVAVVRETGAKMPADLGGVVYIPLMDRHDIAPIETQIRHFLETRL